MSEKSIMDSPFYRLSISIHFAILVIQAYFSTELFLDFSLLNSVYISVHSNSVSIGSMGSVESMFFKILAQDPMNLDIFIQYGTNLDMKTQG